MDHPQVAVKHGRLGVYRKSAAKVEDREVKFFLPKVNCAQPIPCVIMPFVCTDGMPIELHSLVEIFVGYKFVPTESERVSKGWVKLDGSLEKFKSSLWSKIWMGKT